MKNNKKISIVLDARTIDKGIDAPPLRMPFFKSLTDHTVITEDASNTNLCLLQSWFETFRLWSACCAISASQGRAAFDHQ
eukprot:745533-Amphidinium_carterae.1